MRRLLLNVAWVALALAGCRSGGSPEAAARTAPGPGDGAGSRLTAGVTRAVLDNGLTVLLRESHEAPIVTTMIWYRIGSADEAEGESGIAHFLEHMMFKGTTRYRKLEIDRITQRNGGQNNAFTNKEYTAYYFDFASDRWAAALEIESDRMRNCLLDEEEFQMERQVVLKELGRRLDTPWERLDQEVDARAFSGHAYAHPVIGWAQDLTALTRERMAGYYNRFYVPRNAVLVLVGDFDAAATLARVRELFGRIPGGNVPARRASAPAPAPRPGSFELQSPHNLDRLMIAYRGVPLRAPDDAALDVLSGVLGGGRSSRLYRRLVEGDRLAADVGFWSSNLRVDGLISITAELLPGKEFAAVERAVADEIDRLGREPLSDRELQKAKNSLEADTLFAWESAHGRANALGAMEALVGYAYLDAYLDKVRAVSAGDVRAAARKYFRDDAKVVGRSLAKKEGGHSAGRMPPHEAGRKQQAAVDAPAVGASPPPRAARFSLPPIARTTLPNGLTVLALRRPGSPALALRVFVDAGLLVEPEEKAGLARLVGDLILEGTAARSGQEIAEAIEFVGGSLEASPTGLTGKALWKDADLLLDLAADALGRPSFPEEAFSRVREQALSDISGEEDQPAVVGRNLFMERVYGRHPLHRPALGYRPTVEALTREDAVRHHDAFYRPRNAVVAVVGDAEPEALVEKVRRHFGGWADRGPAAKPALPAVARQAAPLQADRQVESSQAHVFMGHLGIRRSDPDYHALLVMDHVFGLGAGFTDRLSRRIRDELGLAYQVYATISRTATVEPGTFRIYLGTGPEKKDEALREVRAVLERFVREGPTDEEVNEAKAYLLGSYVFDYESASELAEYLIAVERFGLGLDYLETYPARIAAVTREEVFRVAKKHLDPAALTTVVVGPGEGKSQIQSPKSQ